MKNGTFHQIIGKNIFFIKSKNGLDQIIRVKVETQGKVLKFAQPEIHYEKNGVKINIEDAFTCKLENSRVVFNL